MAFFPTNNNFFEGLTPFGSVIPQGVLTTDQEENLRKQALVGGLLGAGANYLSQPKNQGYGSALPYLAKSYVGGMGTSQGTIDATLNNLYKQQLLALRDDKDKLYNVDGALVDRTGKVVYQGAGKVDKTNIGSVDPSKFTVESLNTFATSGKYSDLKPLKSPTEGLGLKDIYGAPEKDINGNLVYVPKVPGQPIRDMSGKPIAGNVQLADKKEPTESQANAFTYFSRMEESDKIIKDLNGKYDPYKINIKTSGKTALIPGGQDVANYFLSENEQKVEQAQRNFINAVLRRESGAVISPDEFSNANTQYFPQPNDKPGNLKQKAANRKTAIEGIKRAAGPSIRKASQDGQSNVVNFEDLQ